MWDTQNQTSESDTPAAAPADYPSLLSELKQHIARERLRVVLASNAALVLLAVLGHRTAHPGQAAGAWLGGTHHRPPVGRPAHRLSRHEGLFPAQPQVHARLRPVLAWPGLAWPERPIVQEVLAQLAWYHDIALLEKLGTAEQRLWYAHQACTGVVAQRAGGADRGPCHRAARPGAKQLPGHLATACSPTRTTSPRWGCCWCERRTAFWWSTR